MKDSLLTVDLGFAEGSMSGTFALQELLAF